MPQTLSFLQVEPTEEATPVADDPNERESDRVYLDLTPVKSFLHGPSSAQAQASSLTLSHLDNATEALPTDPGPGPTPDEPCIKCPENLGEQVQAVPCRKARPPSHAPSTR